jgi:acyl carrier protein
MMTQAEALKWIAELFEQPADELSPDTPLAEIPMWDSLGVLTLMADFDQKFGIVLADSDMRELQKVDDILDILRKQGKLQPAVV